VVVFMFWGRSYFLLYLRFHVGDDEGCCLLWYDAV
jgi:hypothetical protein